MWIIAFEPDYIFPSAQPLLVAEDDKERVEKTSQKTQMVRLRWKESVTL